MCGIQCLDVGLKLYFRSRFGNVGFSHYQHFPTGRYSYMWGGAIYGFQNGRCFDVGLSDVWSSNARVGVYNESVGELAASPTLEGPRQSPTSYYILLMDNHLFLTIVKVSKLKLSASYHQ